MDTKDPIWYHPEYITNILSLAKIKEQYRITYDSSKGGTFVIHVPGSNNLYFHCYSNGLHLIECNDGQFSFVQTIAGNMEGYSVRQIKDDRRALARSDGYIRTPFQTRFQETDLRRPVDQLYC